MNITEIRKEARMDSNERFLTILSGARKVGKLTPEDKAYNNALADIFDFIIENESSAIENHTKRCGKWVRD